MDGTQEQDSSQAKSSHTPEPWQLSPDSNKIILTEDRRLLGSVCYYEGSWCYVDNDSEAKANAARIVACVNALAGLNPEAVKDVVCVLRSQANQLDRMAEMLLCKDSPGHANYISKQSAAEWSDGLASELRTFLAALKGGAM